MSHDVRQGKMNECSGAAPSGAVILEEPEGSRATAGRGEGQPQDQGPLRCAVWPRQQTWLCVVPLLIGFVGLGLSLMLLKWIVVGTVRDYVPTDLVDANRIGQDPIFLSKPSGIPKSPDTTTTTTTPSVDVGNPTLRTVTVTKGRTPSTATSTTINPRGGGASGSQVTPWNPVHHGRGPSGYTTTTVASRTTFIFGVATSSPSPANPTVLHDSTQMWATEQTTTLSTTVSTRSHSHRKTPSPTVPPLHSEHFKPCHEKDLAYCLNGGECFVIETLSGPHKHCKCREGYQGIRCDQFLPKTDSILSDPNHLGIEFMESKEVYKRQVLSITSIAVTISLLGTVCMALYCRSKRRRTKLQAHLKESRSLKTYAVNSHNPLETKTRTPDINMPMHEYCKRSSQLHQGNVCESSFEHCHITTPSSNSKGIEKHQRSGSLSPIPDHRVRSAHWSVPRRTPPTAKGRLNPIGGSKCSGPAYQHLQEVDSSEREAEAHAGCQIEGQNQCDNTKQDSFLTRQFSVSMSPSLWSGRARTGLCTLLDPSPSTRSLRRSGRRHSRSPPPFRSCSIPIIPAVQCHNDSEASCMQTSLGPANNMMSMTCKEDKRKKHTTLASSSCSSAIGQQQDEVVLLLEEAQEQLRALVLAHRKQEEGGFGGTAEPRETVCFLNLNGSGGPTSCNGPTQTQLLSPSLSHRDLGQSSH
ncbi:pro-neuregulin-3, membrane-bound isoform [Takifugu flavidus]|uniref:pro-neuregulin-3, membrane-bound isoform n=1 Tax=Takifugu flavidus TaxID=433684 RepID=UPI002544AC34|nr:pro-neuregulin-3, membrane-bound isoform [Takifugu flavidus]XP_056903024.1 pro-neuregulin-3, membrane-bound isoform [Takifugu flavidus]